MEGIEFIQSMQKLELKRGDFLILKTNNKLSEKSRNQIIDLFEKVFKPNLEDIKIVVLEDGMDIGVLRKEVA